MTPLFNNGTFSESNNTGYNVYMSTTEVRVYPRNIRQRQLSQYVFRPFHSLITHLEIKRKHKCNIFQNKIYFNYIKGNLKRNIKCEPFTSIHTKMT